jgi:hypothetical protein
MFITLSFVFESLVSVQLESDSIYNLCGNEFQVKGEAIAWWVLPLPCVDRKNRRIKKLLFA